VLTTAGKPLPKGLNPGRARIFDYLPGERVCAQASLVVCNGGSPTTNQALAHGVPVLGIARNMDQFLNMRAIERFGAGLTLRADRVTPNALADALERLFEQPTHRLQAGRLRVPELADPAARLGWLAPHAAAMLQAVFQGGRMHPQSRHGDDC